MKVKIVKAKPTVWYRCFVGRTVEVIEDGDLRYQLINNGFLDNRYFYMIDKSDCEIVNEELNNQFQLNQAISLLESKGYKVEAPCVDPTDEEICERIRHDNEKVGWTANWDKLIDEKYYLENYNGTYGVEFVYRYKALGTTYTNKEIAETIVSELNEKRFVRV